ncbi:MAG: transketolase [Spirochaetaceae bacterium]|nr:transketolase [Spirochaetaceae bacterium]
MNKKALEAVALSIRSLSIDAIQKAKSGHPGMPLGCAELAAVLYGEVLKHNPADSQWVNRDRFLLSAGHGSMLLYSILHLSGYKVSIDDIKSFRQLGSKCPGHPEYGCTDGVETTSGPLGQGIALAVGQALAESFLATTFNTEQHKVVDHYTYSLVGEGCLMEGVSSEASSIAGHLQLGKLIVFYDENRISIDGCTDDTFSEDIAGRYRAYGWQVLSGSMYDVEGIVSLVEQAKKDTVHPTLIMLKSVIGNYSPLAGSASSHGAPLGEENVAKTKQALGIDPNASFFVPATAYEYFAEKKNDFEKAQSEWNVLFEAWSVANPEKRKLWDYVYSLQTPTVEVPQFNVGESLATRAASGKMLQAYAKLLPTLVGGSADLEGPNATALKEYGIYSASNRNGRTIRFGVREFAMADIAAGMVLHGGMRAFCATFAVFADYMRPAIRMASLMKLPVIYILTHDSIYVGEDGPTHQPVETIASLRGMIGLQVLRPGDAEEVCVAWQMAMNAKDHPVCLLFTRQNVPVYEKDDPDWKRTIECGGYIVRKGGERPDVTLLATGSEVSMALNAAEMIKDKIVRVVSVVDQELFARQPEVLRKTITGDNARIIVVEAGIKMGWEGFTATDEDIFCLRDFGVSAPGGKVAEYFGFTAENLAKLIEK